MAMTSLPSKRLLSVSTLAIKRLEQAYQYMLDYAITGLAHMTKIITV